MKIDTFYFEEASQEHTDKVLAIVKDFLASNPSIEHIVAATTEGTTGVAVAEKFNDKSVIIVSHQTGFVTPNENELSQELRERILHENAQILTSTHAFAGVARGIRVQLGGWQSTEVIAVALRTFGQGTKVCAEIALMAADAGLVPTNSDVICIAGTGRGADTAWLIQPANTQKFSQLRMKACLCKPLSF